MSRRAAWLALVAAGCHQSRSLLAPAGPAARTLAELGWPVLIGFTVVSALSWGFIAWLALRRTGRFDEHAPVDARGGTPFVAIGGFIVPAIAFTGIFLATLRVLDVFPMSHRPGSPAEIKVIAHQWWWEIEYRQGELSERFRTANELHLPTGRSVELELVSSDVIHSFWVPRLHGKVDLVPGLVNHLRLEADAPGEYQGACAEFCGLGHAKMRFRVIADRPADFARWLAHQRRPEVAVAGEAARRGREVFLRGACPMCHAVKGTSALATVGPDLTHIGSRRTLAAGWLPKDPATLHAWIVDAQAIKPGARMPRLAQLSGSQLQDLAAYLEALE